MKALKPLTLAFGAAVTLGPFTGCASRPAPTAQRVVFNQDYITHRWTRAGMSLPGVDPSPSLARSVHDERLEIVPDDAGVSFDNPRSIARFVLEQAPQPAYVLPSERYYYFRFHLGGRVVSGNLRFTDIDEGTLHTGFFDVSDLNLSGHASLGADEGVSVTPLGGSVYRVEMDGIVRDFTLAEALLARPASLDLLEGEEFVSGVLDESGTPLALLWNEPSAAFYYVLNADFGSPEPLSSFGKDGDYLVGRDSRFVYHRDSAGRLVLVGVSARGVQDNTYFDGPFDQVPPNLPLKDKLERAYPYVTFRGGIDEHGNFKNLEASRVAVSPYLQYSSLEEMESWLDAKRAAAEDSPSRLAAMTYESKRDFHKHYEKPRMPTTLGEILALRARAIASLPHALYTSQGWPANHRVESSNSWPASHDRASSSAWPKNHFGATSAETDARPTTEGEEHAARNE